MSRPSKTVRISQTTLKTCTKALNSWTTKHENGEFVLEDGTYEAFKKASGVISCEIARQIPTRKRNKTINVRIINDQEAQAVRRQEVAHYNSSNQ
tara:strand:+ start:226 stop:510 length:285 start_codon:yes stop_codon:yes gene_type:complete